MAEANSPFIALTVLAMPCMPCHCHARLIFSGKQMNDDKLAKDFNIEGGSVLHLVGPFGWCKLLLSCSKFHANHASCNVLYEFAFKQ